MALILFCIAHTSYAAVFKCDDHGEITFSDKPCKGNAQDITDQHLKSIPKKQTSGATSSAKKTRELADKMEASRIQREINRDISSLQKEIDQNIKLRDSELLTLNHEKELIGHGDNYDDELRAIDLKKIISDKESAVRSNYSAKIEKLNKKITSLRERLTDTGQ